MKFFSLVSRLLGLAGIIGLAVACEKDDINAGAGLEYDIPGTYTFDNVSYNGQLQRLGMLQEMRSYMRSANAPGVQLDAARLKAMYSNNATLAGWQKNYEASKQLRDKTFPSQQALFERLLEGLAAASQSAGPAGENQPGIITSKDGTRKYLVGSGGIEYNQLIEKGLMGACFYYQATAVYLDAEKMSADNTTVIPGEGTAMQHHWDEAFGYLGVPADFPQNKAGVVFWGQYSTGRDSLFGTSRRIMDAFLLGRAAINNKDLKRRDEAIAAVRKAWEEIAAGSALSYLNQAVKNYDDLALRAHALSEGAGFIYSLQFNPAKRISNADVSDLLAIIGGSNDFFNMNFYKVPAGRLIAARDKLAGYYGFSSIKDKF